MALAACGRSTPDVHASPVASSVASAVPTSFYGTPFERQATPSELAAMGRALFADKGLSASGTMACASCHDPAHAYGPTSSVPVRLGGVDGLQPGIRAVPSLKYAQDTPAFNEHFSDTDGDDSVDQGPTGGRGWDGRASSVHEQASLPLLSSYEMANASSDAAIARLRRSQSAAQFRSTFGEHVFDHPAVAWNGLLLSLEVFQQSPSEFYPYSSKYDAFLRGKATLTTNEARGLAAFNDPARGNCALCHPSAVKRGAFPQFTDRGFIAIGVPRNAAIPANANPAFVDLGLCGPLREDLRGHPEYCGLFKTPSLRNVALRPVFFHNGVYRRLADAVRFYAMRDSHPDRVYPRDRHGQVMAEGDLPQAYAANLDRDEPFGHGRGETPTLSDRDVADIVAFLNTLTDGFPRP